MLNTMNAGHAQQKRIMNALMGPSTELQDHLSDPSSISMKPDKTITMKQFCPAALLALLFALTSMPSQAQVEYLRLSPSQTIVQRVGATDVTLEFSRPQRKGRTIFGELVPYGKMWRTGANENTIIRFSHRVKIGETEVPAGDYALFTKPFERYWEIYLYAETNNLDVPNPLDSTKLLYLSQVEARTLSDIEETLVINFYDLTETSAQLGIRWEQTEVMIPIEFYTQEAMELAIQQEMQQNILDMVISASYYQERDMELEKAKQLQELAMALRDEPSPWDYHSYGIILYKMGDKDEALESFKKSLTLAEETNNEYLIEENKKWIAAWNKE